MADSVKKILLVEDEANVINFISKGLEEEGYEVTAAPSGKMGLELSGQFQFDVIILDIMLPDINGMEVCSKIRESDHTTPILFLTALGTSENIALGLNNGADDYLVKPFKFIELNARIHSLLRRSSIQPKGSAEEKEEIYKIADLEVNDTAKTVKRGGQEIGLTATEYRLLLALVKNRGKVLSRTDLLEMAWDIHYQLGTNVVEVYVNYLRKKVDAPFDRKLIQTIVGMGYVLKESVEKPD